MKEKIEEKKKLFVSCALDGSISVWEFWFERTTQSPKTQIEKSFFLSQQLNKEKLKTKDPKNQSQTLDFILIARNSAILLI